MLLDKLEVVKAPVYHSARGRLLKVLYSSVCRMNCLYCPWRAGAPVERRRWSPWKLARVALEMYRHGIISGVFISSGLYADPERVAEDVIEAAELLRRLGYRGYLHLRLMPGTPKWLIHKASRIADRVGINLETVDASRFSEVAPSKGSWSLDILSKLLYATRLDTSVDTQVIVGVAGESDTEHIRLMEVLVRSRVDVVYHSPFTPIPWTPLSTRKPTPSSRARVLHQAWRLLRDYWLDPQLLEDLLDDYGMLPRTHDLKALIAERHPHLYPVDPWSASRKELLLVPGIGPHTANRIIAERARGTLTLERLRKLLGPRWRRAARYLDLSTCGH